MPTQPLADLTVLELSTMIAGPYAGQMLGDLGADVIKIERPGRGELARGLEPTIDGQSFYYLTANRNKRSVALDITTDDGREIFLDLATNADVVLENFQPGFTTRYGIDYDNVREHNPRIIYCSISAYGETGPYRTDPGIDTTVQALTGAMSMARTPETPPMRSGVPMNDVFAALHATQAILTAVLHRHHTDEGDHIDISLLDAGLAGLTTRAMYSLVTNEPYPPFGRRHNYFAPEGTYETADGDVQLSVVTDRHWEWFCEAIDAPDLATDDRFMTTNDRVTHQDALDAAIEEYLRAYDADTLVTTLRDAGIPAAPVNDTVTVWDDPQVQARDMRQTLDHLTAGTIPTLGFPVKYDRIEPTINRAPPILGEHSREVLTEIGYADDDISDLIENRVLETTDGET